MAIEIRHSGETVTVQSARGTVTARSPSFAIGVTSGVLVGGIPYLESYEITPTTSEQIMPTRSKTMADDVTIHKIPYAETSNDSGGITISIAS